MFVFAAGILGHYYQSTDCFKYPKKSLLKTSQPKNTHKMFWPKKIPESKISTPKKSFDHHRHLKSGVPPPGGGGAKILSHLLLYKNQLTYG